MLATEVSCISCLQGQSWQKIPWIIATILNAQTHLKDSSRYQISQIFLPLPNFFVVLKIHKICTNSRSQKGVASVHEGNKAFKLSVCDYSWFQNETTCWNSSLSERSHSNFQFVTIVGFKMKQHVGTVHDRKNLFKLEVWD